MSWEKALRWARHGCGHKPGQGDFPDLSSPSHFLLPPENSAWHKWVLNKYLLYEFIDHFRSKAEKLKCCETFSLRRRFSLSRQA